MSESKNKLLIFVLGLTIGILAGGVMVFLNVRNSEKSIGSKEEVSESTIEKITNKVLNLLSEKRNDKTSIPTKRIVEPKSAVKSVPDTLTGQINVARTDSALTDTAYKNDIPEEEKILVKKDELITVRTYEVLDLNGGENRRSASDSLLEVVSGVRDDSKKSSTHKNAIIVEYWRSPINYKGYKMGKNKLVLFGINEAEPLKFIQYESYIYMKSQQNFFRLDFSNEFRAFEKVTNPLTLGVLTK